MGARSAQFCWYWDPLGSVPWGLLGSEPSWNLASIAALARLRPRAALAKRLALGRYKFKSENLRKFNRKPCHISFKILPKSSQLQSKPSQNPSQIHPGPSPNPPSKIQSKTFLNFIQNPPKFIANPSKTFPKSSPNPPRTLSKPSPGGLLGGGGEMSTKFHHFCLHFRPPGAPFQLHVWLKNLSKIRILFHTICNRFRHRFWS